MTDPPRQTVPTFLVAGAARCGTTGLVEGLRTHSRVFMTDPKEPHYFALYGQGAHFAGPGDSGTINRATVADREAYLALYPTEHDYLALGDGSVSTMFYAERAVPEILRISPQMRLVVILREPVERAYSSYLYLRARGFETEEDFLAAVADEPRRKAENWHHLWLYPSMSYYAEDLAILRAGLGEDRVGVFFTTTCSATTQERYGGCRTSSTCPRIPTRTSTYPGATSRARRACRYSSAPSKGDGQRAAATYGQVADQLPVPRADPA